MNYLVGYISNRTEIFLLFGCLAYFMMNGAQLFETVVIIPKWTSRVPESLSVLKGPFAPDLKKFWIVAHSLHEIIFIAGIIASWHLADVRNQLLLIFILHCGIRMWTIIYFAPQIMRFQQTDGAAERPALQQNVQRWKQLNYIRVAAFLGLSAWMTIIFINLLSHA